MRREQHGFEHDHRATEGPMEFERASLEIDGTVAILSMNHPEVLNAVSAEMLEGMTAALDALAKASPAIRCLVITGAGRAFSTGANLQGRGNGPLPRGAGHALETQYHRFCGWTI
jgi:2-(1,2-epoxy-1,2-dihydrophenyl)acetyl-CoA isomerase